MSASRVATYAAARGEIDAEARARPLEDCWAPDGGPHLRFGRAMKRPDGTVELERMDDGEVDDAGRLTCIVGFIGALS